MKRFWLKGIVLAAMAALALVQWQNDEPAPQKRLSFKSKLSGVQRKAAGAAWYMSQRMYGLGYIPPDAELRAVEHVRTRMMPELAASLQKSAAAQLKWEYHGPGNIGGRLRGLVVHPNNPNILYAGSVAGGVWKSTNAGASWVPTMNDLITLNISALAMKPGDPNTLYAGTGEGLMYFDNLPGRGILKTSDGGSTWRRMHIAQGLNSPFITALAVSPANPNVVYASGRKALPFVGWPAETVPDAGINAIFKSTDSGETWQDVTTGKGIEHNPAFVSDNIPTDVLLSPADADLVYAAFGLYYWGGIWKSADGGQTWSRLLNGLPDPSLPNMGYGRIKLAMAPSNPNILYASFAYSPKLGDTINLKNDALLGIWKTTNAGQSWTQVTTPLTSNQHNRNQGNTTALGSQGGYAHALIVHPTDPNIVFIGGLDIYKTTDGGNTWAQVSMWLPPGDPRNPEGIPYVHADHHMFAFEGSTNPPTLYNGSDGGVARSRDLGRTWEILNYDLGVTQFYTFAVHPTNRNIMLGGTQDNGTPMVLNDQINAWEELVGADGWQTYFDHTDPTIVYASTQQLGMARIVMNYTTGQAIAGKLIGYRDGSNGITKRDYDNAAFYAPYELSPNNPNVLVLGTNRLLRSTNRGDSWTALSTEVDSALVAVAIADGNDNIMWFATTKSIFKTEDGGATYANVTRANLPKRFLTDIEFDPSNNRNVYLTYSGYGTPHVFKSTNAGASWADISSNLPDVPANSMQVHPQKPNLLFLGTDVGVFLSENGGQTWQPCTNNFPTVQVTAIFLHANSNRVYAATHGRGAFSAEIVSGAAVLSVNANEIQMQTKPGQIGEASFTISNTGNADLSFDITTSGGEANILRGKAHSANTSLARMNEAVSPLLAQSFLAGRKEKRSAHNANEIAQAALAAPPNNDMLVLDDGNDVPDNFIGEGPGSSDRFYWMNQFDLAQDFVLKGFDLYMRSEALANNVIEIAVMDSNLLDLVRGDVPLPIAPNGGWFVITLTNVIAFKAGNTFFIEIGGNAAIACPAGADKNAQVPQRSFHYNWAVGDYEAIGAMSGFENGAYLIRAFGTKSGGGTNQPPVAKAQLSKSRANVNEAITFDASQSFDPDGQITKYLWNFGDGNSSTEKIATHAYAQAGNYLPKLTVTDDKGATGQAIGFITIASGGTSRLAVSPASGTIAAGGSQTIRVTFDANGLAEGNYQGQISITSNGGNKTVPVYIRVSNTTEVENNVAGQPRAFRLEQNYPNPFNPETGIRYELPHDSNVTLAVFDLNGRRVALLESGLKTAGQHFVRWDGRDDEGRRVASGVYFYRLDATTPTGDATTLTKKMTVMK
jgi:photosystem II stability/assembly factor-like uncharacterized protein